MQVEISPATQETLDQLVRAGEFESTEEALAAAVLLLAERHRLYWERVDELLEDARRSIKAGTGFLLTPENKDAFVADIARRGRERLAAEKSSRKG
jgi:Arc/MetJ-type ribon-helix-helix transcriptional regulator